VLDLGRIDADDAARYCVDRDLVVAEDDESSLRGSGVSMRPSTGDDGVDGDELRLDDVLEIGDLVVERMVVIDEAVTVVLDSRCSSSSRR